MPSSSKLKKKGMEMEYVYMSVLAAIILVLISVLLYKFYNTTKEKLEIQDCRNSIGAHAFLTKTSQREIFTDIKCPTRELLIDVKNEEKAKKEIAEDMRRCWYEWQKGDAQLFKSEGIFCHVCSVYNFKQKDEKIEKFQTFLMTEDIDIRSVYPEDTQKMSYIQYFQGYKTKDLDNIEKTPKIGTFSDATVIDTSKKYTSIFVYASGKTSMQEFMEGGHRTTALIGGGTAAGLGATAAAKGVVVLVSGGPPGWIIGGVIAIGIGSYAVYEALTPEDPQWMSVVQFMEYDDQTIKDLGCQYLEANQLSSQQP